VVAVDVDGGVDVLHLDGEQAQGAQEQVVDLAAPRTGGTVSEFGTVTA